jgi:hypothetical protein
MIVTWEIVLQTPVDLIRAWLCDAASDVIMSVPAIPRNVSSYVARLPFSRTDRDNLRIIIRE